MKKLLLLLVLALVLISCQNKKSTPTTEPTTEQTPREYPTEMATVLKAHGGMDTWNKMNNLCFTLENENGDETHTTDLKSRKTRIESPNYVIGMDGEKTWIVQDSTFMKPERVRFYHNLMFYFYAMPFVLGDEGTKYSAVEPLEFEGKSYPGTKVSFESGVGDSSNDEYILYRDAKTNKMAWLAYTVTFGQEGKSDRFSYIRYTDWQDVNGLLLPEKLEWYNVEDGKPTEPRNERVFVKPSASPTELDAAIFEKPKNGEFTEE